MSHDPARDYQQAADGPLPGDDAATPLTRRQTQKAEAILSAYLDGDDIWAEALPDVAALLQAAHMHALVTAGQVRGIATMAEAAARLDTWPWPAPSRHTNNFVDTAVAVLSGPGHDVHTSSPDVPGAPGLYAVHGDASTWHTLGLGEPPDKRPLYVGKAERSLADRDIATHFANGRTGQSTLRRSLGGLLVDYLGLRAQPRNTAVPGYFTNYALEPAGDQRLTEWMLAHLRLATWPSTQGATLDAVETDVLQRLLPPLNLDKVITPWRSQVLAARAVLAEQARNWKPAP